jgi:hypothetical protein
VAATDPAARAVRKAYGERVGGPVDRAQARLAKARFAVYGTSVAPDATFTPRLSYGKIAGWAAPPFTYFKGLYERATGQPPFQLTQRWIDAEPKLNPNTVFDIASTADIIPGNSGSPLINAKGEVIGAIFDGNRYMLSGFFAYDSRFRAVSVSTAAITEALEKVYDDPALVKELTAQ